MNQAIFENIEKKILVNLKNAKNSIKVAVAWFTNPTFFNLVLEKKKDGVDVQIILADDIANFKNPSVNFQELIDLNGFVSISRFPILMHHKFCLIDDRLLITGSYNWTLSAEHRNIENIILTTDLKLIHAFEEEFFSLIEKTEKLISIKQTEFNEYQNDFGKEDTNIVINVQAVPSNENTMIIEANVENIEVSDEIWDLYYKAQQFYFQAKYTDAITLSEEIIVKMPRFSDVYELMSRIFWRQKKYKEQREFAEKATDCDSKNYAAYNSLGIVYAEKKVISKSIENYDICIQGDPTCYTYYWNRGLSNETLANDALLPINIREQCERKSKEDFKKTIKLTDKLTSENYMLCAIRGRAKLALDRFDSAKQDLEKALKLYKESPKEEQDIHILREIKASLKEIERIRQS